MEIKGLTTLSLFDGISCGKLALDRAGIHINNYYASEVNKSAIYISKKNNPNIKHHGDVRGIRVPKGFKIDLLIGGSPCQGFSFNGGRLDFKDPRSALFFEYLRILKEARRYNPDVKFLLENVHMSKFAENTITELLGVEPVKINSCNFSAQSRPRNYWTNITFDRNLPKNEKTFNDIRTDDYNTNDIFLSKNYDLFLKKTPGKKRLEWMSENIRDKKDVNKNRPYLVAEIINDTPSNISRQSDRVYHAGAKSPCLTAAGSERIKFDMMSNDTCDWRTINIVEAERLQTVPDNYTEGVLLSKRFEALGNGWTVDVVSHIFKGLRT